MPSYWGDYSVNGYIVGDSTPTTPTSTQISISRNFILGGGDITRFITSCNIDRRVDRVYTSATLKIRGFAIPQSAINNPNERLTATIGTDVYSFIIIESDSSTKEEYEVLCRTEQCQLLPPFTLDTKWSFFGNSSDILQEVCSLANVTLYDTTLSTSFKTNKGSLVVKGTLLDVFEKLVKITGSNYYDNDGVLVVEKAFRISNTLAPSLVLNDNITTNRIKEENKDGSDLVHKVLINSNFSDIYSIPRIAILSDCELYHGTVFAFNPRVLEENLIHNLGNIEFDIRQLDFETELSTERLIVLDGAIEDIVLVLLNGVETTDYVYQVGHNILLFTALQSGAVKITYTTKLLVKYSKRGTNGIADISYFNQQIIGNIEVCKQDNQATEETGDEECSIESPSNVTKDEPFSILITTGAIVSFTFISDSSSSIRYSGALLFPVKGVGTFDTTFLGGITKTTASIQKSMTKIAVKKGGITDPAYLEFFVKAGVAVSGFKIGSSLVNFTQSGTSIDGLFDRWITNFSPVPERYFGATVSMLYTENMDSYNIPACGLTNEVKYIDVFACGNLQTITYPDPLKENPTDPTDIFVSCNLPQTVLVDVAGMLTTPSHRIAGSTLTSSTLGSQTVDSYGKISVTISTTAVHTLDGIFEGIPYTIEIDSSNGSV